jgi:hypothetical protein
LVLQRGRGSWEAVVPKEKVALAGRWSREKSRNRREHATRGGNMLRRRKGLGLGFNGILGASGLKKSISLWKARHV